MGLDLPSLGLGLTARCHLLLWLWLLARLLARLLFGVPDAICSGRLGSPAVTVAVHQQLWMPKPLSLVLPTALYCLVVRNQQQQQWKP